MTSDGTQAVAGRVGLAGSSHPALASRSSCFRGVCPSASLRPAAAGLCLRHVDLANSAQPPARLRAFSKRQMARLIRNVAHACHPAYVSKLH